MMDDDLYESKPNNLNYYYEKKGKAKLGLKLYNFSDKRGVY